MLRILSHAVADGPSHMALDEALLEAAAEPTLRTYRWAAPTLSLGYFQDHDRVVASLPEAVAVVRRITGGGAIWHQHEVTYAMVGVLGEAGLPRRTRDCYPLLHAAIARAIAEGGGRVERQTATVGDRRYRDEPRCFASPAAEDLIHPAGGKILGSAGRTRGARVLIHGSLKLASNPWDGPAVAGCGLTAEAAQAALRAGVTAALGLAPHVGKTTTEERAATERIRRERYGDAQWVVHRRGPRA